VAPLQTTLPKILMKLAGRLAGIFIAMQLAIDDPFINTEPTHAKRT